MPEPILRFSTCVASVALAMAGVAQAQTTGNPGSNATSSSVEVFVPLTIESTADLRFGAFTPGPTFNTGDRIIVGSDGTISYLDGTAFIVVTAPRGYALFDITGAPDIDVVVTVPTGTLGDLGPGLQLLNLISDPVLGNPFPLSPTGEETYRVGGTLRISNAAVVAPGSYSLAFPITVQYF